MVTSRLGEVSTVHSTDGFATDVALGYAPVYIQPLFPRSDTP
jgi:hypothetical protein